MIGFLAVAFKRLLCHDFCRLHYKSAYWSRAFPLFSRIFCCKERNDGEMTD